MSKAAAFLAGMGTGYLSAREKAENQKRQDKIDARAEEDYQFRKAERDQAKADKDALRTAGTDVPVQEVAGTLPRDEADMDMTPAGAESLNLPKTYKVGASSFAERGVADAEAQKQNAPAAKRARTVAALTAQGKVVEADQLAASGVQAEREGIRFTREQEAYAKKLVDEGVLEAAQALRRGDGQGMAAALNSKPGHKVDGPVQIVEEIREIKGVGKVPTFTATFNVKTPDGTVKQMKQNSHDLSMSMLPIEKWYDMQLKATEVMDKGELRAAQVDAATARADASRARAAGGGGSGGGSGGAPLAGGSFDPMAGFDPKNAQAEATKLVDAEIAATGTPVSPAVRANLISKQVFALQDAYGSENSQRLRVSVFKTEARKAKTPEEIAAVRERAAASGYTPQEMAAIDPRFVAKPAAPAPGRPAAAAQAGVAPAPARPAAVQPADPLTGKGQQEIRSIKATLLAERNRWAGNAAAGKRIAEIDALLQRIDQGRY